MRARSIPAPRSAEQLRQDHAQLEQRFEDLIKRSTLGDWRDCDAVWSAFSDQLAEHMRHEEEELLPAYADSSPEAGAVAQKLREEHTSIRHLLDSIGLDIQLHAIRAASIRRMVAMLREHAEQESRTLYLWLVAHAKTSRAAADPPSPAS